MNCVICGKEAVAKVNKKIAWKETAEIWLCHDHYFSYIS